MITRMTKTTLLFGMLLVNAATSWAAAAGGPDGDEQPRTILPAAPRPTKVLAEPVVPGDSGLYFPPPGRSLKNQDLRRSFHRLVRPQQNETDCRGRDTVPLSDDVQLDEIGP